MDAAGFLRDVEAKPATMRALADLLDAPDAARMWPFDPAYAPGRVLLTGMGSSWFAADTAARRLRRAGVTAMADLASVEANMPPATDLTVVAITASGASLETIDAVGPHFSRSRTVGLTNSPSAELPVDHVVQMHAGVEEGGVACRSYTHTLIMLLQLERQLTGGLADVPDAVRRAADSVDHLLATRDEWLPALADTLGGPHGTWLLAPAERLGNALQGALMLREGPRRAADGCETGDWNHVDVYLTKTLDYRALLFTGSRFDEASAQWMRDRGSRFALVGPSTVAGAEVMVRHPHDTDPLVSLLTEVLVPELLAAHWWAGR